MRDLVEQALELQNLLARQGWKFCFIGGVAIQRWSEPLLTKDMDITCSLALAVRKNSWTSFSSISNRGWLVVGNLH